MHVLFCSGTDAGDDCVRCMMDKHGRRVRVPPRPKAYVAPSEKPWMPSLVASTLYSAKVCASAALMKAMSGPKLPCAAGQVVPSGAP